MLLTDARFRLGPNHTQLHEPEILEALLAVEFEFESSVRAIEELCDRLPIRREWFDLQSALQGGVPASETLLLNRCDTGEWEWDMFAAGQPCSPESLSPEHAVHVAAVIRGGRDGDFELAANALAQLEVGSNPSRQRLELLGRKSGVRGTWGPIDGAGVYRREHAGLIVCSTTTRIAIDPLCLHSEWMTLEGLTPDECSPVLADAVLLTHSHDDHWHLPSVLRCAKSSETPVIVPRMSQPSLLSREHLAVSLELVGQRSTELPWWSRFKLGDISIRCLPFFGEQPSRIWSHPNRDVRNWGNCYRLDCPEFSIAVLADCGVDAQGDIAEALVRTVDEDGPLDAILTCCFTFPEGYNPGLPHYFLTIPLELSRAYLLGHCDRGSMTLGPSGVARVCEASGAPYLLPYAHGYAGPFKAIPGERKSADAVRACLGNTRTRLVEWSPGDTIRFGSGGIEVNHLSSV